MSDNDREDHDLNAIAAYAEGRLTPADRSAVAAHLSNCETCRATLAGLLREMPVARNTHQARVAAWLPIAAMFAVAIGGGWLAYQYRRVMPPVSPASPPAAAPSTAPPPPAPAGSSPSEAVGNPPAAASRESDADRKRASDERHVAGKTFRLVAGEWIDTDYDRFALFDSVTVSTREQQQLLLRRVPGLQPFLSLNGRLTVVYDGTVYRFDLPSGAR